MSYYVRVNEEKLGPFALEELEGAGLRPDSLVWCKGMTGWESAIRVPEIKAHCSWADTPWRETDSSRTLKPICWLPVAWMSLFMNVTLPIVFSTYSSEEDGMPLGIWVAGLTGCLVLVIMWCRLHYRCWSALPTSLRFTTPARAVGFLFIPLFNLYWAFVSWPKLSEAYLKWQSQESASPVVYTQGLATFVALDFVVLFTVQPYMSSLYPNTLFETSYSLLSCVLWCVYYSRTATVANALTARITP